MSFGGDDSRVSEEDSCASGIFVGERSHIIIVPLDSLGVSLVNVNGEHSVPRVLYSQVILAVITTRETSARKNPFTKHLLSPGAYQNLLLRVGLQEGNISHARSVAKLAVQKCSCYSIVNAHGLVSSRDSS